MKQMGVIQAATLTRQTPAFASSKPITLENGKLNIDTNLLESDAVYQFTYLDQKMFVWKDRSGNTEIREVADVTLIE